MDDGTRVVQRELDKVFHKGSRAPSRCPCAGRDRRRCWRSSALLVFAGVCYCGCSGCGGWRGRRRRPATVFIAPWLFGFLALTAGPILASIFLSFCDYDVLHPAQLGRRSTTTSQLLGEDSYYLQNLAVERRLHRRHSAFHWA